MTLKQHGHAVDGLNDTQRRVHRILSTARNPLSAYEVLDKMRAKGAVTPPTIYRSLEKLIEKGLAHRLESVNAYVACQHHHPHHHEMAAFAICDGCGAVSEFTDPQIGERLAHWSESNAFSAKRVTVEVRGLCDACAHVDSPAG
ncbi:Fur family transcriptional regulator [Microvirga antarctica]|uniref:Fur family transcriptional regulator n=1 Tax=Microvirga antarctica TaxID=2819233 RepID=UPI001B308ECE|nr:Fur family transcriptional regulator [Microvirga antarctica]